MSTSTSLAMSLGLLYPFSSGRPWALAEAFAVPGVEVATAVIL